MSTRASRFEKTAIRLLVDPPPSLSTQAVCQSGWLTLRVPEILAKLALLGNVRYRMGFRLLQGVRGLAESGTESNPWVALDTVVGHSTRSP